jgi:hypothetical protein
MKSNGRRILYWFPPSAPSSPPLAGAAENNAPTVAAIGTMTVFHHQLHASTIEKFLFVFVLCCAALCVSEFSSRFVFPLHKLLTTTRITTTMMQISVSMAAQIDSSERSSTLISSSSYSQILSSSSSHCISSLTATFNQAENKIPPPMDE